MKQYLQHMCNEMDNKAHEYMNFQRAYYTDKAGNKDLMVHTTQPFWQSMCLSKRRLASKGLTMDVQIERDRGSKTVKDERLCMRRDGHHWVGNKATNVIANRTFYKNGKPVSAFKNREICNVALLKTQVNGKQAACPNCGHIKNIVTFIDGCDACGSKYTVHDFQTKISGFSLEENTSGTIKSMVKKDMLILGTLLLGCIVMGMLAFIIDYAVAHLESNPFIHDVDLVYAMMYSMMLMPALCFGIILFGIFYLTGSLILISAYEKQIVQEGMVKKIIPTFSAGDFYQNLEYKLRNIHLTDRVEEVSTFARCDLKHAITEYVNVVDCDMSRLKFKSIKADSDGYRVGVIASLRLTEYDGKRISITYEELNLTLFGKPQVVCKPVTALREYKCPGCGSSINILEGGRCNYCGNTFDYSAFGWVIETYEGERKSLGVFQRLRKIMVALFALSMCICIMFPCGSSPKEVYEVRQMDIIQSEAKREAAPDLKELSELYDGLKKEAGLFDHVGGGWGRYRTDNPADIAEQYKEYLVSENLELYIETENAYVFYEPHYFDVEGMEGDYYYLVGVLHGEKHIFITKEYQEHLDLGTEFILRDLERDRQNEEGE